MLLTVDEARALKPQLAQNEDLHKELPTFSRVVTGFTIWFFCLTTIRSLVVATVIVSLFNQEPDLLATWNQGYGVVAFLLYLLASVFFRIVNVIAPIAIIIAAFTVGDGIASNFVSYVLPIAIAYVTTFGLIFFSNTLLNSIIKSSCPKIYIYVSVMTTLMSPYNPY